MLLLLLLVAGVTNTLAQNVTIKATNGSMVAALATGYEDLGYKSGGFATWQHEQLSMVLTTSDQTNKTPSGQLDNPANNIYSDGSHLQLANSSTPCYVSISLPKGYRFTGYTIKFSKPNQLTKGPEDDVSSQVVLNDADNNSTFGETDRNFSYITSATATVSKGGSAQIISRTENETNKMSNVLYFVLGPASYNCELITIESAEFFFTAEENYSPVTPAGVISSAVSAVDVAYSTSRVDYGKIETTQSSYGSWSRISYDSEKVKDLKAYLTLFQENAVKDGVDIDGVTGKKVVDYDRTDGTITSEAGYFKLSSPSKEQVYYIETPSHVTVSDSTKVPVGYRIIGAELQYGKKMTNTRSFYITANYDNRTYYLYVDNSWYTSAQWTERQREATQWTMDADGFIQGAGYYMYFNNGRVGLQWSKPDESEKFGIDNNNNIYQLGWPDYYIRFNPASNWWEDPTALINPDTGYKANYEKVSESSIGTNTTDFTLTIYNADGSKREDITVNDAKPSGTYPLTGLNNDAIKFGVKGIGLVRATLTLQALDPYLNSMRVVCEDQTIKSIRPSQVFTANDFSVSGGEFFFHMPESSKDHNVLISFEDLKSKYFDDTYTGGSSEHTSRLNFVRSAHYDAFGTSNNSVYNNTSEAANATKERQKVTTVGTAPFKFNNADEVGENGGTLTEFPFSLENYSDEGGDFTQIGFKVEEGQTKTDTAYVFTTDETRYNISPATAVQHRAYAFYKMIVHVSLATYTEQIAFEKIYDKTLYRDKDGKTQTHPFFGVTVTAPYGNNQQGYAATDKVNKLIREAIINDGDDVSIPKDSAQILYVDFSQLEGVYQTTTAEHQSMDSYSNTNAANCLIFLPPGSTAHNDNTAYKSEEGSIFYAANNIVLTDMQPFYSPYEIHMEGKTNKVEYTRQVTYDKYGKPKNASLILPFKITLTDGTHTNTDGTSFTVHTLKATDAFTKIGDSNYAYAPKMIDVNEAEANKPYIIVIEGTAEGKDVFKISQEGGVVAATTGMGSDYTFTGHSASGTENVTMKGSYAGQQIEKTKNIYYFANNEFVNSKDYVYDKVNSAPFRAYFVPNSKSGAKLASFGLIFSEGIGDDPTGISSVDKNPDLMVIPGSGVITMTSTKEQNVRVHSTSGVMVNNTKLQAGETQTIQVPAGIYVINGVKIIVK